MKTDKCLVVPPTVQYTCKIENEITVCICNLILTSWISLIDHFEQAFQQPCVSGSLKSWITKQNTHITEDKPLILAAEVLVLSACSI